MHASDHFQLLLTTEIIPLLVTVKMRCHRKKHLSDGNTRQENVYNFDLSVHFLTQYSIFETAQSA